jgi:hypothetical protein
LDVFKDLAFEVLEILSYSLFLEQTDTLISNLSMMLFQLVLVYTISLLQIKKDLLPHLLVIVS